MGSNMAEQHPVGFQWVVEAKERGAKVIHVDPRFTRTSAMADRHIPIRAGTDVAFLGGIVNYIFEHDALFTEYVRDFTNGPVIISPEFRDVEDASGFFSGWNPDDSAYGINTWGYEDAGGKTTADKSEQQADVSGEQAHGAHGMKLKGGEPPHRDDTMQHERCVLQIVKRHFARYTPEFVAETCGCSEDDLIAVARAMCENSGRERTTSVVYSVGWTQHTIGVQNIRAASIVQLLLGNIGRPGGGILALRGHANIQGSTDIPTLYNILPGYIPMPHPRRHPSLEKFIDSSGPDSGAWGSLNNYMVSLLKAWWGDAATEDNDFCFDYLPRINGDHSHYAMMLKMLDGGVRGMFCVGQNPTVGSANSKLMRLALAKLDWLVVRDFQPTETGLFWKDSPEHESGEVRAQDIQTEVFFLPAAAHTEKDGNFTNTQRLLQWHWKACEPPEECRSELHWIYHLGKLIRQKLAGSSDPKDRPILDLTWDYPLVGPHDEPDAAHVLQEISGRDAEGNFLDSYDDLKADGSTTCGSWIHCGIYKDGVNQSARKTPHSAQNWIAHEWGWAWPKDTRIIYNRASADADGKPWSERKRYVWWDADEEQWTSLGDSPGLPADEGAGLQAQEECQGARGDPRRQAVHPPSRRAGLAVFPQRSRRWTAAEPLRAARDAVRQPAVRPAAEPDATGVRTAGEPVSPGGPGVGSRRVPVRADHLPADRAPHRRRDVAHRPVPRRAPA